VSTLVFLEHHEGAIQMARIAQSMLRDSLPHQIQVELRFGQLDLQLQAP
jgi:uncharacterized protein (DUF305 family)